MQSEFGEKNKEADRLKQQPLNVKKTIVKLDKWHCVLLQKIQRSGDSDLKQDLVLKSLVKPANTLDLILIMTRCQLK